MNYYILFYTQILQNIWWIISAWVFYDPPEILLFILSFGSMLTRIVLKQIEQKEKWKTPLSLIFLIQNCLYLECSMRMPMNNPYTNHSNALMILINYIYANQKLKEHSLIITKLGFPIYALLRWISLAFINTNYAIFESCVIVFILVCTIALSELKKANCEDEIGLSENRNFKFISFGQQDSKKQSLGASFKKSRTHYSQYHEKPDIFQNIPIFNEPRTMEENLKSSIHQVSKMKRSYNHQKFSLVSQDKSDQQLHTFFTNLINNLYTSSGIVIINQQQRISFMSNKCEKLLECKGVEKVIESIKNIILEKALEEDFDSSFVPPPRNKAQMNKAMFERIMKQYYQKQLELDIFHALLFPQKYLNEYYQTLSPHPHSDIDYRSSLSESFNETYFQQKDAIIYEHILSLPENSLDKKLKIVIIPTYMTSAQQEQLSYPSQQKVSVSKSIIQSEIQPIILIKIKNITKKHKIEQMNKEKEIHNSLLKSFSHELKTPLNSSQDMLWIIKDMIKDQPKLLEFVEIAHISILFLIHQINDILDYAAMQSNTFHHKWGVFRLDEVIEEIKYMYHSQVISKKIEFKIKVDERISTFSVNSDKQRIMQVLINLLNNSCKFTPQGGKIGLSVKIKDYPFIKIQVKDTGIGIGSELLSNLKRVLQTPIMGRSLHQSRIKKGIGLGLSISARIVENLTAKNDGILGIISNEKTKGTKIYFLIENMISIRDESLRNPMISEYTTKNNTYKQQMSYYEGSQCSQDLPLLRQFSDNSSKLQADQSPSKKSRAKKSKFFNLIPAGANESSLDMNDIQNYSIEVPRSPEYFRYKVPDNPTTHIQTSQITKLTICSTCIKVLIVDDIPFNQIALKALLLYHNIRVDQAYDGKQAIELVKKQLQKHCQYYKIIFMDIEMPGINGFQATKEILEITQAQTIVIMCSAYDTQENFRECEAVGMTEFLPKPVHQKDLERILKKFHFI